MCMNTPAGVFGTVGAGSEIGRFAPPGRGFAVPPLERGSSGKTSPDERCLTPPPQSDINRTMATLIIDITEPQDTQTIELGGVRYVRRYRPVFCEWCDQRVPFHMAKGVPESSAKYNRRKACCPSHGFLIRARNISATLKAKSEAPVPKRAGVVNGWQLVV